MNKLIYIPLLLLLAFFASCKQSEADRYQRYLESLEDSTSSIEFVTPVKETEGTDPFGSEDDALSSDGELITVPETPQEREVDMNANTYELERIMMGKE